MKIAALVLLTLAACGPASDWPTYVDTGVPCYRGGERAYVPAPRDDTWVCVCGTGIAPPCVWGWLGAGDLRNP